MGLTVRNLGSHPTSILWQIKLTLSLSCSTNKRRIEGLDLRTSEIAVWAKGYMNGLYKLSTQYNYELLTCYLDIS